jgi:hypothetical protein
VPSRRSTACGPFLILLNQASEPCEVTLPESGYISSAAKLGAIRTALWTASRAAAALGPASLIEHPLLEKWTRDVHGFEFMEGMSNIQRIHVWSGAISRWSRIAGGAPEVTLTGGAAWVAELVGVRHIAVTLTHQSDLVVAVAVASTR